MSKSCVDYLLISTFLCSFSVVKFYGKYLFYLFIFYPNLFKLSTPPNLFAKTKIKTCVLTKVKLCYISTIFVNEILCFKGK